MGRRDHHVALLPGASAGDVGGRPLAPALRRGDRSVCVAEGQQHVCPVEVELGRRAVEAGRGQRRPLVDQHQRLLS
ncbi:hypothetical protein B7486_59865, partial [cyanobacterium TDX16]